MSESRWEIGSGCNLILTIEGEIEGGATPADTAPETEAVRAAIKTAIAAACPISFTYGRGSMPGAKRTVQPLAFLDRDLFEAIQLAPEKRSHAQTYRASCVLRLEVKDQVLDNPSAYDKCRSAIEHHKLLRNLDSKIQEVESSRLLALPDGVTTLKAGLFAWFYRGGVRPLILKAPSDTAMAEFVKVAGAAAVDGRTGRTKAVTDAIVRNGIDWPGWYQFGLHLTRRIRQFEERGGNLESIDLRDEVPELDWPGIYSPTPLDIVTSQVGLSRFHNALSHVPSGLRIAYLDTVREDVFRYTPSQLSCLTVEQIASLDDFGLVERLPLVELLPYVSMRQMHTVLSLLELPLPSKKNRRSPYEEIVRAHEASHPEMLSLFRKGMESTFLKAPPSLTWHEFHCLRRQVGWMGQLLYVHLAGLTQCVPFAHRLLSG